MDNPYQSPASIPTEHPPKRSNSRPASLLFTCAVFAAVLPIPLHCGVLIAPNYVTDGYIFVICYLALLLALWVPSLVINVVGIFTLRPASFLGLLFNIMSLMIFAVGKG